MPQPWLRPNWDDRRGPVEYKLSEKQLDELEELSIYQCTTEELAHHFGVCRKTFYSMMKRDPEMGKRIALGQSRGKRALRSVQFRVALSGNPGMLMYLGRCYLGQIPDATVTMNLGEDGDGNGEVGLSEAAKAHLVELAKHLECVALTPNIREIESETFID